MPCTVKLQIWIWKTLRECKWKTVHQKCIEFPLIEVYKYLIRQSPNIMNTIFKLRQNTNNLKNVHAFEYQNPRTKKFGLDSIAYRASQHWKNIPEEIRHLASLLTFKESIKKFIWILVHGTVVKLKYNTSVIFCLFKFSGIYRSTLCSTYLRVYIYNAI